MATWLGSVALVVALAAAVAGALAGFGTRNGWWHFRTGFQILTWAAYGGAGSVVVAIIAGLAAKGRGRAMFAAGVALIIGGLVAGIPWHMKHTAQQVPAIHDITTDINDPPRFVAIATIRKDAPNSIEYGGPAIAAQQQEAYPDIKPMSLSIPADQAFARAREAAQMMKWDIVSVDPAAGLIEATDTTFLVWF